MILLVKMIQQENQIPPQMKAVTMKTAKMSVESREETEECAQPEKESMDTHEVAEQPVSEKPNIQKFE